MYLVLFVLPPTPSLLAMVTVTYGSHRPRRSIFTIPAAEKTNTSSVPMPCSTIIAAAPCSGALAHGAHADHHGPRLRRTMRARHTGTAPGAHAARAPKSPPALPVCPRPGRLRPPV